MSYPMIHLCVAQRIAAQLPGAIRDLPQFYLGSLAPDAVHFRPGFGPDDKKASHLCPGDAPWGAATDDAAWAAQAMALLARHAGTPQIDFVRGYCAHILTDIQNGAAFWTPYRQQLTHKLPPASAEAQFQSARAASRQDETNADNRLHAAEFHGALRQSFSRAEPLGLEGLVSEEEVAQLQQNILLHQYAYGTMDPAYAAKYVPYDAYLDFIDSTAKVASSMLLPASSP